MSGFAGYVPFSTEKCGVRAEIIDSRIEVSGIGNNVIQVSSDLIECCRPTCELLSLSKAVNATFFSFREIKLGAFLLVDKDVLWVTPDIWEQLRIMSNLEWNIN